MMSGYQRVANKGDLKEGSLLRVEPGGNAMKDLLKNESQVPDYRVTPEEFTGY
jgi:hypothetical protein